MNSKELFLSNLKFAMEKKNFLPSDVARLIGVRRQQISNLFSDYADGINTKSADKISEALGLEKFALFQLNFKTNYKSLTK